MNEAYFKPFIYRLKKHCQQNSTDRGENFFQTSVQNYFDVSIYNKEIAWLQTLPMAIGATQSLSQTGDYLSTDILNHTLIATRTPQNKIQVLDNICKHRASTLLSQSQGNITEITCPYHGWRYNLCGELMHCPNQTLAAPNLKLEHIRLTQYPSYHAAGLLWTQLSQAPFSWDDYIAPLINDFHALWERDYHPIAQFTLSGNFNWKIAVESFLEIYHFSHTHQQSIPDLRYPNIALMDKLDMHARIIIPMNSFAQLEDQPENDWSLLPHTNIMYYLFPCQFLLVMRGFYAWICIKPQAVDKTHIQLTMLVPEHAEAEIIQRAKLSTQGLEKIISEDISICNELQKNIQRPNITHFNYTLLEHLIEHFHTQLERLK